MKKYELSNEYIEDGDRKFYRIRALKDLSGVKAGDLGGYVERETNLSQNGGCWIYNDALVKDFAYVCEDARVGGKAVISDHATVYGQACVCEDARVFGNARVFDNAKVRGEAIVRDNAIVCEDARVIDRSCVMSNAYVHGLAQLVGRAEISNGADISDDNPYMFISSFNKRRYNPLTFYRDTNGNIMVNGFSLSSVEDLDCNDTELGKLNTQACKLARAFFDYRNNTND